MKQNVTFVSGNVSTTERMSSKEKWIVFSFFLAVFIVGLDSFIISPLLAVIGKGLHTTTQGMGWAVTLYAAFYAIGAPIIAPFSEKSSRKKMIMAGLAVFTMATISCGFANQLWFFYAARALAGLGAAMFTPNVYAYIGGNFNREQVGKVMGMVMAALSLSIAVGVPIGSFIAGSTSWNWTFWISGIISLIALFIIMVSVKKDIPSNRAANRNIFKHYQNIIAKKQAWLGLFMMLFWMYSFYAIYTFLGVYIENTFSLSTNRIGLVFIAYGLSNFASSFFGGWISKPLGMKKTIILSGLVCTVLYLLLALTNHSIVLFIIVLALVAFFQGVGVPQLTTYNAVVLPESRSTMTSLSNSFLYLGLTLGSSVGGYLIQSYSFLVLSIVSIVSILISVFISKAVLAKNL
ncbi:UNVERIFIED_ORG: DHA1 family inner membrane transport protein [Heyndrickxia coagulans]